MMQTANVVRGCGTRSSGGAYLCTGKSNTGIVIELLMIDPAFAIDERDWHRGYTLYTDSQGITHVIIFVGAAYYFAVADFIEESRLYGISRKVNNTFPWEKFTPGLSKMYYAHKRAIPLFKYRSQRGMPLVYCNKIGAGRTTKRMRDELSGWHINWTQKIGRDCDPEQVRGEPCVYGLFDLAYVGHPKVEFHFIDEKEDKYPQAFSIQLPSFTWEGIPALSLDDKIIKKGTVEWAPGVFMSSIITHVEFKDYAPDNVVKKINDSHYQMMVLDY